MTKFIIIFVLLVFNNLQSQEQIDLTSALEQWKATWNKKDIAQILQLFHPDSKIAKGFADTKKMDQIKKEFSEMIEKFGDIEKIELGKLIERKKIYVMKVKYSKSGDIPGTFSIKKDDKGVWLIDNFNIDGQGEPELKQ